MNKKKTIILLVIGILVVTISSIGITYSYMKPKTDKINNETEIGINNCAKITLKDNDSTLNLENMYPMEEEMGLQTDAYEFTISSTCEEYTGFNLYLLTYSDNGIDDNLIRYGITSKNDAVLETNLITNEEASDITEEEIKEINQGINKGYKKIYKVYSNNIPLKGESEYKLHIWIDENADNTTMNKNIKLGVIVKGYEREETMAEYLIAHKDNTLIYHDGLPDYDGMPNADLEAKDLSYRFSGANPNNYVCLNDNNINTCETDDLYRIIGLFKNDLNLYETKLIKVTPYQEENISVSSTKSGKGYYWSGSKTNYENSWKDSTLNTQILNINFINSLDTNISSKIVEHSWIVQGNTYDNIINTPIYESYKNEIQNTDTNSNAKIGLLYVSDFGYSIPSEHWNEKNNDVMMPKSWLYLNDYEDFLKYHSFLLWSHFVL